MSAEIQLASLGLAPEVRPRQFACRGCGHEHAPIILAAGETARCVRCNYVLAKKSRFGPDAPLAFTLTGLLLTPPSMLLPFITVGKLGNVRTGTLLSGVTALWGDGMHLVSAWVLICGGLAPFLLLAIMTVLLLPGKCGGKPVQAPRLIWIARTLTHWAIPEVQVLAVLVALAKLGRVVHVTMGPAFWCYSALAVTSLLAWRSVEFECEPEPAPNRNRGGQNE